MIKNSIPTTVAEFIAFAVGVAGFVAIWFVTPAYAFDNGCVGGYDGNGNYYQDCYNDNGTYNHGGDVSDYNRYDNNCYQTEQDGSSHRCY